MFIKSAYRQKGRSRKWYKNNTYIITSTCNKEKLEAFQNFKTQQTLFTTRSSHTLASSVAILWVKACTKGLDSPKRQKWQTCIVWEVHKHKYHHFMHFLTHNTKWRSGAARVGALRARYDQGLQEKVKIFHSILLFEGITQKVFPMLHSQQRR